LGGPQSNQTEGETLHDCGGDPKHGRDQNLLESGLREPGSNTYAGSPKAKDGDHEQDRTNDRHNTEKPSLAVEITEEDFYLSDENVNESLDLIALCRHPLR
jgi:hypothetical protein